MFALVLLFFFVKSATPSLDPGISSNETGNCFENERRALLTFKSDLIDETNELTSWSREESDKDCCKWSGIECSNRTGHVIKVDLPYYGYSVRGNINPSLLELRELSYLDLSGTDFQNRPIPKLFGSFTKLKYLDLSFCNFGGTIPSQLGNLSNLNYLALSSQGTNFTTEDIDWLSRLNSLEHLEIDNVDLRRANHWVDIIKSLPSLSYLSLVNCELSRVEFPFLSSMNSSTSIRTLDLTSNGLTSVIYYWMFNLSSSLIHLNLQKNMLKGPIPEGFGGMTSLETLDLSYNLLEGVIPKSFGNLCNLKVLYMQRNNLGANLSDFVENLSGCAAVTLETMNLASSKLFGPLPDGIVRFSSLKILSLSENQLNETVSENLGTLSKLEILDLSSNSLKGVVSQAHLSSLSNLTYLDLSFNPLDFKISIQWVPRFQLDFIKLKFCNLGPGFPAWFRIQKSFSLLDISNCGISDSIPTWFWDISARCKHLNISSNNLWGTLPDLSSKFGMYPGIDMSSNNFMGRIPPLPSNLTSLNLSRNKFSGTLSFLCEIKATLSFLDMSHNLLSGELPDCLVELWQLVVLNLAHNNISGKIPSSVGSLFYLETLYLYNNSFSGELPMTISNCKRLSFLDVGENRLSGNVPAWIGGNMSQLYILSLRSNNFLGTIPSSLCQLMNLQVLDVSMNNLFGTIPPCLSNLTAMVKKGVESNFHIYSSSYFSSWDSNSSLYDFVSYADYSVIVWQGRELEFGKNLGLVKSIDLSSNKLTGEIPGAIAMLFELVALNLSRNALHGEVPQQIGQLKSLLSLDLSRNRLFGHIPSSLSGLTFLGYLDLSNNNFSGKIPSGPQLQGFDPSKYSGNIELCGPPLTSKCPGDEPPVIVIEDEDNKDNEDDKKSLYISMAVGFITGFWGICGAFLLNRRGRHAFFSFLEELKDWLYVQMALRFIPCKIF